MVVREHKTEAESIVGVLANIDQSMAEVQSQLDELHSVNEAFGTTIAERARAIVANGGTISEVAVENGRRIAELSRRLADLQAAKRHAEREMMAARDRDAATAREAFVRDTMPAHAKRIAKALRATQEAYDMLLADCRERSIDEIRLPAFSRAPLAMLTQRDRGARSELEKLIEDLGNIV